MSDTSTELDQAKAGTALLTVCLVEALSETDPTFLDRFLKKLTDAQYKLRDDTEGQVRHQMELLSWTRAMLTGFTFSEGQGKPFLSE